MREIYALSLVGSQDYRYVGLTTHSSFKRLTTHLSTARNKQNKALLPVHKWIRKHHFAVTATVLEVVEDVNTDLLAFREQFWIAALKESGYSLLNLTDGGDGVLNYKFPYKDITGNKYGSLTVSHRLPDGQWFCHCECGKTRTTYVYNLENRQDRNTCGAAVHIDHKNSYESVRGRLRSRNQPAKDFECIKECGRQACRWSYNYSGVEEKQEHHRNSTVTYSTDLDQYIPTCVPCGKRIAVVAKGMPKDLRCFEVACRKRPTRGTMYCSSHLPVSYRPPKSDHVEDENASSNLARETWKQMSYIRKFKK